MKKLALLFIVVFISITTFARKTNGGRIASASVSNTQITKSQGAQRKASKNFTSRRYSALSKGSHSSHSLQKKGGNA